MSILPWKEVWHFKNLELKINLENMTLKISLHGQELDGVLVDPVRMKEKNYIQELVDELKSSYAAEIDRAFPVEPEFYIEGVESGMNGRK